MANKPRIVIINDGSYSIVVYSDIDVDVLYLDGFVDGVDESTLVTVDGEQYQTGIPDLTVSQSLVDDIHRQVDESDEEDFDE